MSRIVPAKCQVCGFSSRHSRQADGEQLTYQACCKRWMCAACTEIRGCSGRADHTPLPNSVERPPNGIPPNDGIYSAMAVSEHTYHSDTTSLSSSGARALIKGTPAEFMHARMQPPDPKPQYDFGHAAHKMVLGAGGDLVRVDAEDWRTKDARIARETAWAQGKSPLLKKDIDKAQRMAGKVFEHPLASKLLAEGRAEMSIYWHDDANGVRRRARCDWINDAMRRPLVVDYKTAISADPTHFAKSVHEYGYHCQEEWYRAGLAEIGLDDIGFAFIVQMKTEPFLVSVCSIEPEAVELGGQINRRAIEIYAECERAGVWPGYEPIVHEVSLPPWAAAQTEQLLAN